MKKFVSFVLFVIILIVLFRVFLGIFVIQPIGAVPEGLTIIYWRFGLNIPFIASVDGLLEDSGTGVSLLGRGIMFAGITKPIMEKEIMRIKYSETLYLWSTGGKIYSK